MVAMRLDSPGVRRESRSHRHALGGPSFVRQGVPKARGCYGLNRAASMFGVLLAPVTANGMLPAKSGLLV